MLKLIIGDELIQTLIKNSCIVCVNIYVVPLLTSLISLDTLYMLTKITIYEYLLSHF